MKTTRTITTQDGITVRRLTPGKWEARSAPSEDAPNGHWLADGRTANAALAKALDNLSNAGARS